MIGFAKRTRQVNLLRIAGPAFIAGIGYLDPGNFATDLAAGAETGYSLLWFLLLANTIAILMQTLACRLAIHTDKTLAANCRAHFPGVVRLLLWAVCELMMVATDVGEITGAAIGISLICKIPLVPSGFLAAALSFLPLIVSGSNQRKLEIFMIIVILLLAGAFGFELLRIQPDWAELCARAVQPKIDDASLFIAVSMLGATVMPHIIHLHSGLVASDRAHKQTPSEAFKDTTLAMNVAWLVNSAMLITFAAFYFHGVPVRSLEEAYSRFTPLLGSAAAAMFGIALIVSGISSTTVGIIAGQNILEGFLGLTLPAFARRSITLVPTLIVICICTDPMKTLITSQVILSFALPFTLVPLVWLNCSRRVMGAHILSTPLSLSSIAVAGFVIVINGWLFICSSAPEMLAWYREATPMKIHRSMLGNERAGRGCVL